MIRKAIRRIKNSVWIRNREKQNRALRKRLQTQRITILSSNCNGGIISHDLGLQFCSPTVNLFFRAEDFIRFCENLRYYMGIDTLTQCLDTSITSAVSYPVACLGDILLFLVHYKSIEEAQEVWNRRKKRVDYDNIVILTTDRDGMTEDLKDRFERLPYRKVMFTHLPDSRHPSAFYISGYEKEGCVGILTDHDTWDGSRPIDQFDYVAFFNGRSKN